MSTFTIYPKNKDEEKVYLQLAKVLKSKISREIKSQLKFWNKSGNKSIQKKIEELMIDIQEHPLPVSASQKPLNIIYPDFEAEGINQRIVYQVSNGVVKTTSLNGHY